MKPAEPSRSKGPEAAPGRVDLERLVRERAVVRGELGLPRLAARDARVLEGTVVHYEVAGHTDEQGRPAVSLRLDGRLVVACDRCAGRLELPLSDAADFFLVPAGTDVERLAIDVEEEAEPLAASKAFDVAALAEDELILALPISPRHEEACAPPARGDGPQDGAGAGDRRRPFAGLQRLLRPESGNSPDD